MAKKYRTIIECSNMINNNEFVLYLQEPVTSEEVHEGKIIKKGMFFTPRLAVCREVFQQEIDAGLDTSFQGHAIDEKSPDITKFLDAYFKLKDTLAVRANILGLTPKECLAHHILFSYYDCMSGGMPTYEVSACRYLCQHPSIDQSELVGYGNTTIANWLEETKDVPDFLAEAKRFNLQNCLPLQLPELQK